MDVTGGTAARQATSSTTTLSTPTASPPLPELEDQFTAEIGGGDSDTCGTEWWDEVPRPDGPYFGDADMAMGDLSIGGNATFCAVNFSAGPIAVEVRRPDGTSTAFALTVSATERSVGADPLVGDDLVAEPSYDDPSALVVTWHIDAATTPGDYTFVATQGTLRYEYAVNVQPSPVPWISSIDYVKDVARGAVVRVGLGGFPADSPTPIGIYEGSAVPLSSGDEQWTLHTTLDPVVVNAAGAADLDVEIDERFTPGQSYCVSSPLAESNAGCSFYAGPNFDVIG